MKSGPTANTREDSTLSEGTASTSSLHQSEEDEHNDLPPAFRSIVAGQKIKRTSNVKSSGRLKIDRGSTHSAPPTMGKPATSDDGGSAEIHQITAPTEKDKSDKKPVKPKKKKVTDKVKKKKKVLVDSDKKEKSKKSEPKTDSKVTTKTPNHQSVKAPMPRSDMFKLDRGNSAILKRNPYAPKAPEIPDDVSIHSLSLDSLPPPEREERIAMSCPDKCYMNSWSRSLSSFGESMDLSGHRLLTEHAQITTSASDEQWARFKLLGRLGLGDIQLSREAAALVERNYSIMLNAIKHIYALRADEQDDESFNLKDETNVLDIKTGKLLEEVQSTIRVSTNGPSQLKRDPKKIQVDPLVQRQLRDYIVVISSMYRDNAFHNFEHASTVLRAVDKVIGLVGLPEGEVDFRNLKHGYGVAREPWNHFALVFAALIHDVDHNGVPNAQLIKERAHVAGAYKNRSVAEQNSIELAWNLLMEPCYKELRESIFLHRSELTDFRSLLVTAVMATDIADKELAALRKGRAAGALKAEEDDDCAAHADMDLVRRKATFVVETLIQVADVSHTMSSFPIFKKWNHRLYKEMYKAFKNGRAESDPTDTWYKGEFGFFDFYIIPLAKKLNECGIHGIASEEYLKNAVENRRLWEEKGEKLLAKYIAERNAEEAATEELKREEKKSTIISLRDIALAEWSSSSDESTAADDFAEGSDDESVSISSDDIECGKRYHPRPSLVPLRDRAQSMAMFGKVPSKASIEIKQARRALLRSKSMELADMVSKRHTTEDGSVIRIRMRSQSPTSTYRKHVPNATSIGAPPIRSTSPVQSRPRSQSPCSGSESTGPKSILKKGDRSRSKSPMSQRENTEHQEEHSTRIGKQPSLCALPESTIEQRQSKSGRKVVKKARRPSKSPTSGSESGSLSEHSDRGGDRKDSSQTQVLESSKNAVADTAQRGRPTSRSKSPASQPEQNKERRQPLSRKVVRRGRRPSRSRSPASSTESGREELKRESDLKRGKRPSMVKTATSKVP